jgi:hypothetical protein
MTHPTHDEAKKAAQVLLASSWSDFEKWSGLNFYRDSAKPNEISINDMVAPLKNIVRWKEPKQEPPYAADIFLKKIFDEIDSCITRDTLIQYWIRGDYDAATKPLEKPKTKPVEYYIEVFHPNGKIIKTNSGDADEVERVRKFWAFNPGIIVVATMKLPPLDDQQ